MGSSSRTLSDSSIQRRNQFREVLAAARAGDRAACDRLFQKALPTVQSMADRMLDSQVGAKVSASDIVQVSMLEAQQDLQSFAGDSESAFMAWLRTVIANNILNEYRYWAAKKRSGARQEMSLESSAVDEVRATEMTPLTTASERERRKRITVAIALLSDEYREVILLRNRDGLSFSDIGQKLNRTADAARMLWGRAIQKLTEQLHDQID